MRQFGLIGASLRHSFSPRFFKEKFEREGIADARYDAFELEEIGEVQALMQREELAGFNVTIPYKRSMLSYVDSLSPEARAVGAVNTVQRTAGGWVGHNTDVYGFRQLIKPVFRSHHARALVLGTGGASLAVRHALREMGVQVLRVSRRHRDNETVGYSDLNAAAVQHFKLIVNTTPVGQWPEVDAAPDIPYQSLDASNVLVDLIYNPEETAFMKKGAEYGAIVRNGHQMLVAQAEAAWRIWNT